MMNSPPHPLLRGEPEPVSLADAPHGRLRDVWLAMFGIWSLVAAVAALTPKRIFSFPPTSMAEVAITLVPWYQVLLETGLPYGWWLVLTPLVVWLVRRLTNGDGHPVRRAVLLVLAAAGLALLHVSLAYVLSYSHGVGFTTGINPVAAGAGLVQRLPASFFAFWLTAGVTVGLDVWRRGRAREREAARLALRATHLEAQLARAGLDALRMQLNPHFLFNTLHTIASTTDVDPAAARTMTIRLSDLLRLTLQQSDRPYVTLQEELDWIEQYLEIQQHRFEERLVVDMRIDPQALAAALPALLLQPIVENALKHGVDARGCALIEIEAARHGDVLRIAVRDRGPGLPAPAQRQGVGVANTIQRLRTAYGEGQHFVLRNRDGGGAEVSIELPFRSDPFAARASRRLLHA